MPKITLGEPKISGPSQTVNGALSIPLGSKKKGMGPLTKAQMKAFRSTTRY